MQVHHKGAYKSSLHPIELRPKEGGKSSLDPMELHHKERHRSSLDFILMILQATNPVWI